MSSATILYTILFLFLNYLKNRMTASPYNIMVHTRYGMADMICLFYKKKKKLHTAVPLHVLLTIEQYLNFYILFYLLTCCYLLVKVFTYVKSHLIDSREHLLCFKVQLMTHRPVLQLSMYFLMLLNLLYIIF